MPDLLSDEYFPASSFKTHELELDFLKSQGFVCHGRNVKVKSLKQAWEYTQKVYDFKEESNIGIDGAVIKINDQEMAASLGIVGKTPRAWCAVKFTAATSLTKILSVVWQTGRTGKITPVAVLEPVLLDGSIVQKATIHNYKEFLSKNLRQGDMVLVHKAGDIIPEILEVIPGESYGEAFTYPNLCPNCQTRLELSATGVDLLCLNVDSCPAQVLGRLSYFTSRAVANISGLSEKILEKMLAHKNFTEIDGIYSFPVSELGNYPGFGPKLISNLESGISQAKNLSAETFLVGLAIPGLGPQVCKLICDLLFIDQGKVEKPLDAFEINEKLEPGNHLQFGEKLAPKLF